MIQARLFRLVSDSQGCMSKADAAGQGKRVHIAQPEVLDPATMYRDCVDVVSARLKDDKAIATPTMRPRTTAMFGEPRSAWSNRLLPPSLQPSSAICEPHTRCSTSKTRATSVSAPGAGLKPSVWCERWPVSRVTPQRVPSRVQHGAQARYGAVLGCGHPHTAPLLLIPKTAAPIRSAWSSRQG